MVFEVQTNSLFMIFDVLLLLLYYFDYVDFTEDHCLINTVSVSGFDECSDIKTQSSWCTVMV